MKRRTFDVDIDVSSETPREPYGVRAMVYNDTTERVLPHPSGVYIEKVPVDGLTGNAAFDYKEGDDVGFFKIDLLTNTSYDPFKSKEELLQVLESEPDWNLLKNRKVVEQLPHVAKHYDLLCELAPRSVIELADFLALIRPGKTHLIDEYKEDKKGVRRKLYLRPSEGIYFKKSHAVSYALMIKCVMSKVHDNGIVW